MGDKIARELMWNRLMIKKSKIVRYMKLEILMKCFGKKETEFGRKGYFKKAN